MQSISEMNKKHTKSASSDFFDKKKQKNKEFSNQFEQVHQKHLHKVRFKSSKLQIIHFGMVFN